MARASKQAAATTDTPKTYTQRVADAAEAVKGLKVDTAEQCVTASRTLKGVAKLRREIEGEYKKKRQPHIDAQREIIAEEQALTRVLAIAESACEGLIKAFRRKEAEERATKEQQEREQREADARAEAQLRADQLRAAAASAPKAVAKRLNAQADIVQNAQPVIDPVETPDAPQTLAEGVHTRKSHHAAVDDLKKLVLQIAAGIMLKEYSASADPAMAAFLQTFKPSAQATMALLLPRMPELNALAKSFPTDLELQGVRAVEDEGFVAR